MGTQYTYNSGAIDLKNNWDLTGYQAQKVLEQETAPNQALEFVKRAIQYSSIINKINKVLESDYNAEYKQAAIAIILIKEFGGDVFLLANGQGALDLLQDAADIVKYYDENFSFFEENFPEDFYQSEGVLYVTSFDVPVDEIIENPEEYPAPAPDPAPSAGTPVPEFNSPDQRPVSPSTQDNQLPYGEAQDAVSPLVLDLDGDGIELVALNDTGSVFWDIDQDGLGEASGWIAGGDGLLAVDLNEDGIINDHGELFGNDTTDGFSILSAYDSNTDDVINSSDANFSDLLVWKDINSDGYSQDDEIFTLSELSITSISLNASSVNYNIAGNLITHESSFTIGGQQRLIVDAWFTYDNFNSIFLGEYDLDPEAFMLPFIRGYGDLPDLTVSMSLDAGLLALVQELAEADPEDLFLNSFDLEGKVEAILYEWAGVESVNPTSRGSYFDARKLEFLESYLGKPFLQNGTSPDPGIGAVALLESAFNAALSDFTTQFLLQNQQTNYFDSEAAYDIVIGDIIGTDEINHFWAVNSSMTPSIDNDVYILSPESTSTTVYELSTGGFDQIWLFDEENDDVSFWTGNGSEIYFSFQSSSSSVVTTYYIEKLVFTDGSSLDFTEGYVTRDSAAGHTIYGSANADDLDGRGGDDTIYSYDGNDTLTGGTGADSLIGALGNDLYQWSVGDGDDMIIEDGGTDEIVLGEGITIDDVRLVRYGSYDLDVYIGTERIRIDQQLRDLILTTSDGYSVETLRFEDNSTLDLVNDLTFKGTSSADTIYGLADNNTLIGLGGGDDLLGGDGNDTLYGGDGLDYLYGQGGSDTFVFEAASAFNNVDNVEDFNVSEDDVIDIADLLSAYDPMTDVITDFVQITDDATHSYLAVDADGGANNFIQIATLYNETGLTNEAALVTGGYLIVT